jgi:hypothetical protein
MEVEGMSGEQALYKTVSDAWKSNSTREEAIRSLGKLVKRGNSEALKLLERIARDDWTSDRLRKLTIEMIAESL